MSVVYTWLTVVLLTSQVTSQLVVVPRYRTLANKQRIQRSGGVGRHAFTPLYGYMTLSQITVYSKVVVSSKVTGYSSSQHSSPLLEITCHMGSHRVTCHPAEVTFQPLPQPKLVLDLATPEGCKAELT